MSDKIIKSYQELCREIEIWESRDRAYQAEIQALNQLANIYGPSGVSGIDYSKDRVQSSSHIGFETYLLRLFEIEAHIKVHEKALKEMKLAREQIEKTIENMSGIDRKVVYLRDIKGMKLEEIADELHFSIVYIKKVSARNKKLKKYTKSIPTEPK
jgi:hypothetical protein